MNTRIRYSKQSDGSLESMRVIVAEDKKEYRANISVDGKEGRVYDYTNRTTHFVNGASAHKTKIAVKKLLEQLGCTFAKEERDVE